MENLFITYSSIDTNVAQDLSKQFNEKGLNVYLNDPIFVNSSDYKRGLEKMISESDIYIIVYSGYNDQRDIDFIKYQIDFIKGYIKSIDKNKLLIPYINEKIKNSPSTIELFSEYQIVYFSDVSKMFSNYGELFTIINSYLGERIAVKEKESAIIEKIEKSSDEYIQEAITGLVYREKKLSKIANRWYIAGYSSIILAIFSAIFYLYFNKNISEPLELILKSIKNLIVIALFIAAAKYCFDLAKTFMNESLKNADRIHAISFGKFYMKVFGEKVNSDEIMKVFKYWNISNNSSFSNLSTRDFDPNFIEQMSKFLNAIKNSQKIES